MASITIRKLDESTPATSLYTTSVTQAAWDA